MGRCAGGATRGPSSRGSALSPTNLARQPLITLLLQPPRCAGSAGTASLGAPAAAAAPHARSGLLSLSLDLLELVCQPLTVLDRWAGRGSVCTWCGGC